MRLHYQADRARCEFFVFFAFSVPGWYLACLSIYENGYEIQWHRDVCCINERVRGYRIRTSVDGSRAGLAEVGAPVGCTCMCGTEDGSLKVAVHWFLWLLLGFLRSAGGGCHCIIAGR